MHDWFRRRATRRETLLAAGTILASGCSGLTADSDEGSEATMESNDVTEGSTTTRTSTPTDEWNATAAIEPSKTSMAAEKWIYNGWNVSVEVTSLDGADRVEYVVEQVNVVEGNDTRAGVVGDEVGATSTFSLLQRGDRIDVYAVRNDERKRIDSITINSSYVAPADGERGWADSWRGEPPET